jgi:hypothetical protein
MINFKQYNNLDKYFDWLGGQSDQLTDGGLYPGVKGKEAVKCMILDGYADEESDNLIYIANAIDTLKDDQLLLLILANYDGTALADMPSFMNELSTGEPNDIFFNAPSFSSALKKLNQAIKYYKQEPDKMSLPEWCSKRNDALALREQLVTRKRKSEL